MQSMTISIHVPSWGTTVSRASCRGQTEISIHVPSWGTTSFTVSGSQCRPLFQSTFPRGERRQADIFVRGFRQFQSTFPRGERLRTSISHQSKHINFNPRSLVGNDGGTWVCNEALYISIHVPSWGTTANFHKYSLFFYAINIIFLLFIIPSLFSLVLFMLLF